MILYRVTKKRHASDLSGKGAETAGGRWNRPGYPALYLAENISLAILETMVHCQCISDLYNRLILSIDVPEKSIKSLDQTGFPKNWNSIPWHNYTIETGTQWLASMETLLLKVPSSIINKESIYILNPRHFDVKHVRIINKEIFTPDNRLALLK